MNFILGYIDLIIGVFAGVCGAFVYHMFIHKFPKAQQRSEMILIGFGMAMVNIVNLITNFSPGNQWETAPKMGLGLFVGYCLYLIFTHFVLHAFDQEVIGSRANPIRIPAGTDTYNQLLHVVTGQLLEAPEVDFYVQIGKDIMQVSKSILHKDSRPLFVHSNTILISQMAGNLSYSLTIGTHVFGVRIVN